MLTVAGIALAIYGADAIRKYNPAMDTGIVSTELGLGVLGIAMMVICLPVGLFAAFDMLFKPETIVLSNGHTIQRKRSRAPLITILLVLAFWASIYMTDFDLRVIVNRGYQLTAIFKKIFQPRWSYWRDIVGPLVETVKMSIMGSALGSLLSLPFAVFASTNINRNKYVVSVLRVILNIVRTLPTLVIASVCALIFKLGAFAGTVAITISRSAWCPKCCMSPLRPSIWGRSRPWNRWARGESARLPPRACRRFCQRTCRTACIRLK